MVFPFDSLHLSTILEGLVKRIIPTITANGEMPSGVSSASLKQTSPSTPSKWAQCTGNTDLEKRVLLHSDCESRVLPQGSQMPCDLVLRLVSLCHDDWPFHDPHILHLLLIFSLTTALSV